MQNARLPNLCSLNVGSTLLIITLLFSESVGFAQSRQRWSFGPRAGLNLTNFVGENAQNTTEGANKLLPGLSAGVGFIYSDISRFGFAFDLLYSQRGNKSTSSGAAGGVNTLTTRINYLELPITARYFLTRSGNFRPNVYAGITPGLRLNAVSRFKSDNVDTRTDITDRIRAADIGVTAGFQANFRAGNRQRFTVDARYTHGLTNVDLLSNDLRNQMITVGLGYNFGIGRQYQPGDRKLPIRPR